MSKFTKADIVDAIYNKTGTSRKEIRGVVDLFIEEIKTALISRNVIELRGFGTFEIKIRKGRQKARNPKTGEFLSVNAHGIASFRPGRELRQDVWSIRQEPSAGSGQPASIGRQTSAEGSRGTAGRKSSQAEPDRNDQSEFVRPEAALYGQVK